MDVHERTLGFTGRDILFRPVEYERYRKPQVVDYPRHAIVLNPQHTQKLREAQLQQRAQKVTRTGDDDVSSSSSDSDDEKRKKKDEDSDDDDDDPRRMDISTFLCQDRVLQQCMHIRWKQVGPVGHGLVNLGNTCFANSVLQAIAYTPALAHYFVDTFRAPDKQIGAPHDFAFALGETIRQMHLGRSGNSSSNARGGGGAYRPGLIISHLRTLSKHFSLGQQSDAHEFAVQLLFACQRSILFRHVGAKKLPPRVAQTTALGRICGGYLRSQVAWRRQEEIQQLLRAGKKQAALDLKLEAEHLRKTSASFTDGEADKLVSNTYDPTTILNVELAGHTLEHCLAKFCEEEKLDGRCYLTPRDVGVHATKQFRVHIPPPVLIIQLKRFGAMGGKVSKTVAYPKQLDLTPFCSDATADRRRKQLQQQQQRHLYELNAICVHEGRSINFGHYYSIVKARNGAWYECNDSHVSPVSEDRALRQQAYMLFYSKIPLAEPKKGTFEDRKRSSEGGGSSTSPSSNQLKKATQHGGTVEPQSESFVGRELTEDEVAALLSKKKQMAAAAAAAAGTGDITEEDKSEQEETERRRLTTHASPKFALKRMRDELSSGDDDDDRGYPPQAEEEEERQRPSTFKKEFTPDAEANPSPTQKDFSAMKRQRYGGIIKSVKKCEVRRTDGDTPSVPEASQQDGKPSGTLIRVGRQAVVTLQHAKHEATPATAKRPADASQFQQRVRDPMWEMEMDKGRVKKVKKPKEESPYAGVNPFQQASKNRFDLRGRRLRE